MRFVFERVDGKTWEASREEALEYILETYKDTPETRDLLNHEQTLRFPYRTLTITE